MHYSIFTPNNINKQQLIKSIQANQLLRSMVDLSNKKAAFYTSFAIDKIIADEYKHDKIIIQTENNETFESMSSGQQRLALAKYIFEQDADYVIIDDIQSNVDAETLKTIYKLFEDHRDTHLYIQLFSRKEDILPYISTVIILDETLQIKEQLAVAEFQNYDEDLQSFDPFLIPFATAEINAAEPLIEMRNVQVEYDGRIILQNINWTIRSGEFWELRGPIGAGKSTLLSMIIGDNPKAFGQEIYLFGRKKGTGESVWDIKKKIGYFYPKMMQLFTRNNTVEEMIISGFFDSVGLYQKPTRQQQEIAQAWLQSLGKNYANKRFLQLSPGEQRIVLVVRALVKQPPLLILDEPTVGLDDANARLFVSMIQQIAATKQIAIIFVSHRQEEGLKAERVFELESF